jgi:hypothetical protein
LELLNPSDLKHSFFQLKQNDPYVHYLQFVASLESAAKVLRPSKKTSWEPVVGEFDLTKASTGSSAFSLMLQLLADIPSHLHSQQTSVTSLPLA